MDKNGKRAATAKSAALVWPTRLVALGVACLAPMICALSSAEDAWPLRLDREVEFEAICDQNQYLRSEDGRSMAVFQNAALTGRGPFGGRPNEAAFASADCLTEDKDHCGGWTLVVANGPITGVSLDGRSMSVRVAGEGVYRVFLDGGMRHEASIDEEPCQGVAFYVGGCGTAEVAPVSAAPSSKAASGEAISLSFRPAEQGLTVQGLGAAASRRVLVRDGAGAIERACPGASPKLEAAS